MAIKPILFNTEMVRASLDGRKSCTRRIVKPQQLIGMLPDKCKNGAPEEFLKEKKLMFKPYCDMTDIELINTAYKAPYQPGDILYVRETWCDDRQFTHEDTPGRYFYKASESDDFISKWRPSIHMPKEAARIWLKVKDVRVERLQDITDEDCEKEGLENYCKKCHALFSNCDTCLNDGGIKEDFKELWNSTIKKSDIGRYGWDANPYVWVIEFERCEKPED